MENHLSRKEVKEGIKRGFADVNGKTVTRPEHTVDTLGDRVCFNGQAVSFKEHIYIVMNKPAGVLSASDDKSRKTVVDIIPDNIRRKGLFPVGRLDKGYNGVFLLLPTTAILHTECCPRKRDFQDLHCRFGW